MRPDVQKKQGLNPRPPKAPAAAGQNGHRDMGLNPRPLKARTPVWVRTAAVALEPVIWLYVDIHNKNIVTYYIEAWL